MNAPAIVVRTIDNADESVAREQRREWSKTVPTAARTAAMARAVVVRVKSACPG
jgi:hypothetical protein